MLTNENNGDIICLQGNQLEGALARLIAGLSSRRIGADGWIKRERGNNMTEQTFLKASQVAELLGPRWSRQRVHVELKRGTFPDPATYAGNQPLWTEEQIQKYKGMKRE